jgi:hypothetical protein
MCKALGISTKAKIKTLSKGIKEKVQLILVMSRSAKLYLLDEPIAGVDPAARDLILDTILAGNPFQNANVKSMNRAAVCCWIISAAAAVRLGVETAMFWNPIHFFSYNTVFILCFFMAGLLFRVMGALFRQASELQEDQNLTI